MPEVEAIPLAEQEKRLLITGAAGSVGALLVEEALAQGYRVRATDRPGSLPPVTAPRLEWVVADLARPDSTKSLTEGMDGVIHAAAWVDIHVPFEIQAPINLDAVRRLYEAAKQSGVGLFVFYSTGSIYAASSAPLTEDAPLKAASGYERTKLLAEDFLRSRQGSGPVVNILRPALIFGPRGRVLLSPMATLPLLLAMLDGYLPGLSGGPRTNMVHALDVARAALFLVSHPQPAGSVFNVAADECSSFGEYYATIFDLAGFRRLRLAVPFPTQLLRALTPVINRPVLSATCNEALRLIWEQVRQHHELVPDGVRPRFDLEALPYLTQDTTFDNSRLKALGFQYVYPDFRSGWASTMAWYKANRWLP